MDYSYLNAIQSEPQIPTHFPNDNSKRIDYVITYKYDKKFDEDNNAQHESENERKVRHDFIKKEAFRKNFEQKLADEGFDVATIRCIIADQVHVYVLLHCKVERLFEEAERTRLEMRLNNLHFDYDDMEYVEMKWIKAIKDFILRRKPLKKDTSGNIITAPYESSIRSLFAGCDDKSLKKGDGPFSTAIRCLLVDNILKTMKFDQKKENRKKHILNELKHLKFNDNAEDENIGLPLIINDGFYEDALILHDPTNHYFHILDMINYVRQNRIETHQPGEDNIDEDEDEDVDDHHDDSQILESDDTRNILHLKWAKLTNIFRSQPLYMIRCYFGELVTFYFAWVGTLIYMLFIPTVIGIALFIYGIIQRASLYGNYYLTVFAKAFDNDSTPYFAFIISIWGALFSEFWNRESARLAFEWDVNKFEADEPDLPEFTRRTNLLKERIKNSTDLAKYFLIHERTIKTFISYCILLIMVCIVGVEIALLALFRIYIKIKAFPNDSVMQVVIGDLGSTIINSVLILLLNYVYKIIVIKFTQWENYRTKTEYEDALIYKLFLFEFANGYGSLFYLAFFRQIDYPNGLFGLGAEYQDNCQKSDCMALLTTQVLVVLLVNPTPLFLSDVVWPGISLLLKSLKMRYQTKSIFGKKRKDTVTRDDKMKRINEKIVFKYITIEKNKSTSDSAIIAEYTQKVILYGYFMLFACSFTLAPLILLIINVLDLRIDGLRLLWLFRRPVAYKAQDIGAWFYIVRFLNVVGIVSNAFIIAFTSNWSNNVLEDRLDYRLLFVVVFEHVVFVIWILITYLYSGTPTGVKFKMRTETKMVREAIEAFRTIRMESHVVGMAARLNRRDDNNNDDNCDVVTSSTSLVRRAIEKNKRIKKNSTNNAPNGPTPAAAASVSSRQQSMESIDETSPSVGSNLGETDKLGVIIKPNVIIQHDEVAESSDWEHQGTKIARVGRRKKLKNSMKNIRISPLET